MKNFYLLLMLVFTISYAQWIDQNAGFTNKVLGFYEFSIVNENTVWAICYDGFGGLLGPNPTLDFTRTIDGGNNWIAGSMGADTTLAFSNISALSATEAWVAMHRFGNTTGGGGGLFHTIDSGITWSQSNQSSIYDANSFPNFVYFKDALNGVSGGNTNNGFFEIYTTTNGGVSWVRTPQSNIPAFPAGGGTGWFNGYCVVGNTVWFGTTRGKIYKSLDFGLTWTINTVSPSLGDRVFEIAFNDDGLHGLAHLRSGSTTKLFATTDGGLSWVQRVSTSIPNWRRDRITSVPGTTAFVSTSTSTQGGSAITLDNGLSWTLVENTTQKAACRFLNSTTGWAGGFFSDNPSIGNLPGIYKWDSSINLNTNSSQIEEKKSKVYPNPTSDKLTISLSNLFNNETTIEIFDVLGRIAFKQKFQSILNREINVNLNNLEVGNYNLKISSDSNLETKKILIVR
jgi:Secretion system C-terminal sorting domain